MAVLPAIQALLTLNIANFAANLAEANRKTNETKGVLGKMGDVGNTFTSIGRNLTTKVTAPVISLGKYAVDTGREFEAAMSQVQALSGATGEDLKRLEDIAREMGRSTAFSATEAAEGLSYMALAGWDVDQMCVALEPILKLAGGAMADLGEVSDIVTDAMTGFGLSADETTRFTDVLATTMSNSNTDVLQLGEAFKYVAPIAGTFGFSVEDVSLVLGTMADNGIKGSQAGTTLRRALQNLTSPTDEQAAALDRLNIELFDNEGNIRELRPIVDDLRSSFSTLTDEEKANAASTLFGANALSGMLALVNQSDEDFNALSDAIDNSTGSTEELYNVQQDNLNGSLAILKSSIEELAIEFSKILIPVVRKVVDWLTGLVEKLQSLDDEQKEQIVQIAAIVAAVGPIILVLGTVITTVVKVISFIGKIIGVLKGLIGLIAAHPIVAAILAVIGVIIYLWNTSEEFRDIVMGVINTVIEWVTTFKDKVVEFFTETIPTAINNVITWFQELPGKIWDAITGAIEKIKQWGEDIKEKFIEGVNNAIDAVVDFFTDLPEKIGFAIGYTLTTIVLWVNDLIETVKTEVPKIIAQVIVFFTELPGKIWNAIVETFEKIVLWGVEVNLKFTKWVNETINNVVNFFKELPGKIWDAIVGAIEKIQVWGNDMKEKATAAAKKTFDAVVDGIKKLPENIKNIGKQVVEGLWNGIKNAGSWLTDQVKGFAKGVVKGFTSALGIKSPSRVLADEVGQWIPEGIAVGIDTNLDSVDTAVDDIHDAVLDGLAFDGLDADGDILSSLEQSLMTFSDGIEDVFRDIANSFGTFTDSFNGMNGLSGNQNMLSEAATGINIEQIIVQNEDDVEKLSQGLFNRNATSLRAMGRSSKNG